MLLPLFIVISEILTMISVEQSWEPDRDDDQEPAGSKNSWFRPNIRDSGCKRGKSRNRASQGFKSMYYTPLS